MTQLVVARIGCAMDAARRVERAAHNNSKWCDAVCRAHAVGGEFHEQYWINHCVVPPHISKLVTLAGPEHANAQVSAIQSLIAGEPECYFSVKDAFQCLDLAPLGFEILFEATWLYWTPGTPLPIDAAETLEWSVVAGADELAAWEQAWRGASAKVGALDEPRIFTPSMLQEPGLHFLVGKRGDEVVASGALNRTGDVVGLCNVFTGVAGVGPLFPGCVRVAQQLYPDIPIVGYGRGSALVAAEKAGFAEVHPLTVWIRSRPGV